MKNKKITSLETNIIENYSTYYLRETIKALKDLSHKYRYGKGISKYSSDVLRCPLCGCARGLNREKDKDRFDQSERPSISCACPWIWFKRSTCIENDYYRQSEIQKFNRISDWILIIKTEIKRRKSK